MAIVLLKGCGEPVMDVLPDWAYMGQSQFLGAKSLFETTAGSSMGQLLKRSTAGRSDEHGQEQEQLNQDTAKAPVHYGNIT